jgi:hypothetical protein
MKYLTVQEVQFVGDAAELEERCGLLMDALLDQESSDSAIEDPDIAADLSQTRVDVQMLVEADDPAEAMTRAQTVLRTAIHAIGDGTPGWETQQAVMHVAPADDSDRLLAGV